jgi:hypothetical protein
VRYTAEQLYGMPNEKLDRMIMRKLFSFRERRELRRWGHVLGFQDVQPLSSTHQGARLVEKRMIERGFIRCSTADGKIGFMMGADISYGGPVNEPVTWPRVVVVTAILGLSRRKWSLRGWLKEHKP